MPEALENCFLDPKNWITKAEQNECFDQPCFNKKYVMYESDVFVSSFFVVYLVIFFSFLL